MIQTYGKQAKRVYIDWEDNGEWFDSDVGSIELDSSGKGWWLFMNGSNMAYKYRKPSRAKTAALSAVRAHFNNGL